MIVYKVTNKINGKTYVGQTVCPLEERWKNHCSKSSGCRAFKSAIDKYGKSSFTIEIIERVNSVDELNKAEEFWIDRLGTLSPNGYNLKTGGNQPRLCEESLKKASQSKKGMKAWNKGLTKEDSRVAKYVKYSEDNYWFGRVGHRKGKKHTEEARKKISDAQKGRKLSEKTKKKMSEVHSGKAKTKKHRINLSKSLKGKSKSAEHIEKMSESHKKPILCVEKNTIYKSAKDAAEKLDVSVHSIYKILGGIRNSVKGLSFVHIKE